MASSEYVLLRAKDFRKDTEGLNYFYKFVGDATLAYARKFDSMPMKETMNTLKKSIDIFEDCLVTFLSDVRCMSATELLERRLMKKKHYVYAAYLAVISSFPILRENIPSREILKAMIAKIAELASIKSLDNMNDLLHTREQAAKSLRTHLKAFTSDSFKLKERRDDIGRAENSMYQLAYLTNQLVSRATNREGVGFKIYLEDFERYVKGQIYSMKQKTKNGGILDIREFLGKVNEKAVGRVWVAVDFCFLNSFWYLYAEDLKTITQVRKAADLIFKGCNIYDDVADLETDLQDKIWNSVIFLALDKGIIEKNDLDDDPETLKYKLDKGKAMRLAIELGDLIFLNGIRKLEEAEDYASRIDVDALKFSAHIIRLFAMRKWLIRQNISWQLLESFSSNVSDDIMEYAKYI